jgi:beta-lactam-binding protein with PASTA domain
MKSKTKIEKEFDTVKVFREIKDKISKDIKGMTFEQLNAYLEKNKLKTKNR